MSYYLAVVMLSVMAFACGAGPGDSANGPRASATPGAARPDSPPPSPAASPAGNTATEVTPMPTEQPARGLDFEARLRVEAGKLLVSYRLKNGTAEEVLVVNRGDTESGLGAGRVYVEPQPDGTVELSQRAFRQPPDRMCRTREVPPYPGVSRLKPGQSISEEVSAALPLSYATPFADCTPVPQMPSPVRRVKFCLGVIRGASGKTSNERGTDVVTDGRLIGRQELLCGDVFELP
ncbi:MAG TPA: hypothetical protein VGX48_12735 [Pyrinomonadaceae bacterium]|nr:hypothetical protein [Pyrinomonadaceae bacterium]